MSLTGLKKSQLETIVQNAAETVIVVNRDSIITYANTHFLQLHECNKDDVIGKSVFELKGEHNDKDTVADIKSAMARLQHWEGNLRTQTREGKYISQFIRIIPTNTDQKGDDGFIVIGRDLTQEKQLGSQLRQARKMEAVGTLAGGIAHDFNNILSAIIGYSELAAMDHAEQKPIKDYLGQILKAAKRAAELISQILTFSRRSDQEKHPLYLKPVIKESLKLLRSTLPTSIEIVTSLDDNTDPILANATQIQQIIMNLCTNAAHAMQEHGGTLTVHIQNIHLSGKRKAWQAELPDKCVELSISDTGHGMTQAIKTRIFEPYFTTKQGGDGTGLGLATVHGLVTNHDGAIHVSTALGKGTTFSIIFPTCKYHEILPESDIKGKKAVPQGNHEKIMVVDDEEALVTMMTTTLTYLGYEVIPFHSSAAAWEAFRENPSQFDCIISDQTMPTLIGTDFAQKVFSLRADMPFILCSGYSDTVNETSAHKLGITSFIMKPVTAHQLASILYKTLHP